MYDAKPLSLKTAFDATGQISWGPFRMEKKPADPWDAALFYVDDTFVKLNKRQKKIMSLLIAYRGETVPLEQMRAEVPPGEKPDYAAPLSINSDDKHSFSNTLKVQLSLIKSNIRDTLGTNKYGALIQPTNAPATQRQAGPWIPGAAGSYRLVLPEPSNI